MKTRFYVLGIQKPLRKRVKLSNDNEMIDAWEKREEWFLEMAKPRLTNDIGPR